jgi:hypothetical protein
MRRWIRDLHLYLGLLCIPYVVVFSVSSILLTHGVQLASTTEWQREIAPPVALDDRARAAAALAALGLSGHLKVSRENQDATAPLRFRASRPGRSYQIELQPAGLARVRETSWGLLGIIRVLHGPPGRKDSLWALSWTLYTELTTAMLLFAVASGVWMALPLRGPRAIGIWAGGFGLVVVLAIAIW